MACVIAVFSILPSRSLSWTALVNTRTRRDESINTDALSETPLRQSQPQLRLLFKYLHNPALLKIKRGFYQCGRGAQLNNKRECRVTHGLQKTTGGVPFATRGELLGTILGE